MNKLIAFELRKLFKNKSFYVCLLVSAALTLLNALLSKSVSDAIGTVSSPDSYIVKFVSNGMLTIILGIFTAILVTDDYSCGTIKNIYARGYSRNEVYLAKYIVSTISALCFLAVSLICSSGISKSLFTGTSETNGTFTISIILQFVLMLAYNSLFFVISMIIGKLGSAVAISIVGPSFVSLALSLVDSFLKLDNFSFTDYWLDNCLSAIQTVNCSQPSISASVTVSVIVIVVSIIVGLKLNSGKEF